MWPVSDTAFHHMCSAQLIMEREGLTSGRPCGVDVVQALISVAAPLLLQKLQGVSVGDLQEEETFQLQSLKLQLIESQQPFMNSYEHKQKNNGLICRLVTRSNILERY